MSPNSARNPFDGDIMRYSTTTTARAAILVATTASFALLGACSPQRTVDLTQSDQLLVLEEIGLGSSLNGYDETIFPAEGPSLIAGDWLAVQCAQAGGYFDTYDWTPVYANVISSSYE
jgi:hypothetical protein